MYSLENKHFQKGITIYPTAFYC